MIAWLIGLSILLLAADCFAVFYTAKFPEHSWPAVVITAVSIFTLWLGALVYWTPFGNPHTLLIGAVTGASGAISLLNALFFGLLTFLEWC